MKNVLVFIFIAIIAFLLYRQFGRGSPEPVRVFKRVADAWVRGDMSKIKGMCADPMTETAMERRSASYLTQPFPVATVVETEYADITHTPGAQDDEYSVVATQTVYFNPPDIKSTVYATKRAVFQHSLGLRKVAGDWQITSFRVFMKEIAEHRFSE